MRTHLRGLSVALSSLGVSSLHAGTTPSISWNIEPQAAGWTQAMMDGEQTSIAFFGDSMSFRNDTWIWFMRDMLDNRFGNAGEGYLGVGGGFTGPLAQNGPRPGLRIREIDNAPGNTGGNNGDVYWAAANAARDPVRGALSPDGMYGVVGDDGKLLLDVFGTDVTVFYIAEAGGGTLRITNGSAVVGTYSAAAATGPELRTATFNTGRADNDTVSVLTFESVTGEEIQINGVVMGGPDSGSREYRVARGGVGPADFLVSATVPVSDQLTSLAPDLAIVMIDWEFHYYDPGDPMNNERFWFERDTELLLDFYEAAMPDTKFILVSHHPFNTTIAEEADILYDIALARGHGFINLYTTWPDQAAMTSAWLLADNIHFNAAGGDWFGRYIYDILLDHTCRGDANNDGSTDIDDLNLVLGNWQMTGASWGDGDVNFDSVVDVEDLNIVLAATVCVP